MTADRVIEELALIAFSDIGDLLDFQGDRMCLRAPSTIPARARRAIQSVKVKRFLDGQGEDAKEVETLEFKFWSKDAALEKLGKYTKLWDSKEEAPTDLAAFMALLGGNGHGNGKGNGHDRPRIYDA